MAAYSNSDSLVSMCVVKSKVTKSKAKLQNATPESAVFQGVAE